MVLSIDQKYIKTPQNTLKTNVIIAPLRISEKGTPDILPLPMPIDIFGLPQETKEDIYCYKKLERMQNLIEKLTIENSSQNGSEIASINTEISINYAHRSDVYALMLLYYKDFLMKRAKITDTFKSLYSSSFECEYYNQLCNEFKDKSIGSKPLSILLNVAGNRSTEFFMNNQALKDRFTAINVEISQLEGKIKKRTTEIEKIFEELKNNLINKKTTKTDLAKTWISVNETMLLDSFNGTKKMEKYKSAEGCVVISNKLYLDGTMQYDQVTQKFNFVPLIKVFKN